MGRYQLQGGCIPSPPLRETHDFHYRSYVAAKALPVPPIDWGADYSAVVWGMLGNNRYGDCVEAGAAHQVMAQTYAARKIVLPFTDSCVLGDYSAATGFNPATGANDNGTNIGQYQAWRKAHGIHDAAGTVHKIGAYLRLDDTVNIAQMVEAAWLFGGVQLGIEMPQSAYDAYYTANPDLAVPPIWRYVAGSRIVDTHCVPLVAHRNGYKQVVSWGRTVRVTDTFLRRYCFEAWVSVSPDYLRASGTTPQGLDLAGLKADLGLL